MASVGSRLRDAGRGTGWSGALYLDLYPRADKSSNAFTSTVRQGAANKHIPEAVLVASLSGGRADDPGLMTHDEVRTLFHEFGHVVHRLIGGHRTWYGMSSTHLERDFVEAPSQMLEEWIWDPATLATFATHYQTGEPIPAQLVMQMRRASEFGQGLDVRGQMVFARVSLSLHDRDPKRVDADGAVQGDPQPLPAVPARRRHVSASWRSRTSPIRATPARTTPTCGRW